MTSVWVGHPKDPYPLGPNAQGGAIAAPVWGEYMKSAKGKFCGDFAKPKVPFVSQPFFGKYSRMHVEAPKVPGDEKSKEKDKSKGDSQGNGTQGGGGTKYPPDQYASPPQPDPNTKTPPGQGGTPPGQGGTAAPTGTG